MDTPLTRNAEGLTEDAGLLPSFSSPKDIRIAAFDLGVVLGVSRC